MKIHILNAVLLALFAVLFGWMFTLTAPDSASAARQVLFLLAVVSGGLSILSIMAYFTEHDDE